MEDYGGDSDDDCFFFDDRDSFDDIEDEEFNFQWMALKGSHYQEKGKSFLFTEAGITLIAQVDNGSFHTSSIMRCDICIEDVSSNKAARMDCCHCFCNDCWTEHFIVKINEGQSRRIQCMAYKGNAICDEAIVRNLVSKRYPDLAEKFDCFLGREI